MTATNINSFVSCIKVKGLHFFPPVITEEKRIELQKYKQQAIKLEKRLQHYKELEKSLRVLLKYRPLSQQSQTSFSEISFTDSHLKALDLSPRPTSSNNSNRPKKQIVLSTDIIDITEYGDKGIKIIDSKPKIIDQGQSEIIKNCDANLHLPTSNQNNSVSGEFSKPSSPVKTRLIRSNSYTLENPSPILLAHLEKFSDSRSDNKSQQTDEILNSVPLSNWSSSDEICTSNENSDFSSLNTVYQNENSEQNKPSIVQRTSPQIELIHADISVQHVTVHNNVAEEKEIKKSTFELSDPNNQLLEILRNIPEDYSKRIIDLIEKERIEQEKEMEASKREENNTDRLEQNLNCVEFRNENNLKMCSKSPENFSVSAESISPRSWLLHSPSVQLIDLESDLKSACSEYLSLETSPKPSLGEDMLICKKKLIFNRDRLSDLDIATLNNFKRDWAARIIGAYTKGYLTRRLLKTERVQSLISTIRDALMCALQLHNAENIDESDVELHRRLINQVTAACYAFHDIFFSLSISEQMYMISTDRQHKLEKAKRPVSAPQPHRPSSIKKKQRKTSLSKSVTRV